MKFPVLGLDENGNPVLFEDEAIYFASAALNKSRSSVNGVQRNSKSGNPFYDPNTGRFANGPPGTTVISGGPLLKALTNDAKNIVTSKVSLSGANQLSAEPGEGGYVKVTFFLDGVQVGQVSVPGPENAIQKSQQADQPATGGAQGDATPEELARRHDTVRDAAREMDAMSTQDVREWLGGKTTRELTDDEIAAFEQDVHQQRISDLLDVLDHSIRRRVERVKRSRRMVRLVPPRGWTSRTLAGLSDDDVAQLYRRLETRGFSPDELQQHLVGRFSAERQGKILSVVGNSPTKENVSVSKENGSGNNNQ